MKPSTRPKADLPKGADPPAHDLLYHSAHIARILDLADDAIISIDKNQTIVQYNQGAEKMFGYSAQTIYGKSLDILLPSQLSELHRRHIESFATSSVVARRMGERSEIRGRRQDGTEFPAEASISKVSMDGEMLFTVIMRDVTHRTLVEVRLKSSLRDKEVLLKEVHHRVKNNLQVVSSLLGLQARSIADAPTRKKFEESQHRIQSMALLHESLYQSDDLARIDFADYIGQLSSQLFQFYGAGQRIELKTDLEPLHFDMDTAVPCGLIVNELLSNALKYGFPEGRRGEVRLGLHEVSAGKAQLTVVDNGVGFGVDFDWITARSLGLRLVRTLAEQLGARVELDRLEGTAFTIEFPVPDTRQQEASSNE